MAVIVLVGSVVLPAVVAFVLDTERARWWFARRQALRALAQHRIPMPQYEGIPEFTAAELADHPQTPVAPACP